jgi:D-3-phosphoglycerate dehydrogenase
VKVVATSPSFSKNETIRYLMENTFDDFVLNLEGKRFSKKELIAYLKDADAAIIGLDEIDQEVLDGCPKLKAIAKYGVGLNNIDIDACEKQNLFIGWSGGVNARSVAELSLGYMLMLCRNIYITSNKLKNGIWDKAGGVQLSGKTIGVIGVGHIAKELIALLQPFKCNILVNDIIDQKDYYKKYDLQEVSKEEIYTKADIISLHTPLDETTKNLIGLKEFESMKSTAYLLNSARGGIIDENALKYALKNKIIAGAAIDVYLQEPPVDQELLELPNLICTPHIGGNSKEAVEAMGVSAINHLKRFFQI